MGSRRCVRTARGRGRGRWVRPAPAARTPEPWPRPRRTGSAGAASGGEALAVGGGRGVRAYGKRVAIGQSSGAARAYWWTKAGGRGKAAELGLGEGAVLPEGPVTTFPQPSLRAPAPCSPPRRVSATLPRHREGYRALSPHRAACLRSRSALSPRGLAAATPRAGTALSGPVLVLSELSAPHGRSHRPSPRPCQPFSLFPHMLRSRVVVHSQIGSRGCSLSRRS